MKAKIIDGYPWWLRPFLQTGVAAITLGRRIYIDAAVTAQHRDRFIRHELTHVAQIGRLGLIRFYWQYLSEYFRLRRSGMRPSEAYRNISFEIEAAAAEVGGDSYNRPV